MFLKIFLIISLVSSVFCSPRIAPFISSGRNAEISEFPFLVSIQQLTLNVCTGVLLNERFVLSAGNCLHNRDLADLTLEYGNTIIRPDNSQLHPNQVRIQRIINHPQFNNTERLNDLCLIEPVTEIIPNFANPFASLAVPGSRYTSGTVAVHATWGNISPGERTTQLQRANLRIMTNADCTQASGAGRGPVRENICAMEESVLCAGDLGAPLIVNRVVVGIASFRNGEYCVQVPGQFPNVYTAVSFYIGWIEEVTGINYQISTFLSKN